MGNVQNRKTGKKASGKKSMDQPDSYASDYSFHCGSLVPLGLYPHSSRIVSSSQGLVCPKHTYVAEYNLQIIKKLIIDRRLAPFYKGLPDYQQTTFGGY